MVSERWCELDCATIFVGQKLRVKVEAWGYEIFAEENDSGFVPQEFCLRNYMFLNVGGFRIII